jgi:hypothetical protein
VNDHAAGVLTTTVCAVEHRVGSRAPARNRAGEAAQQRDHVSEEASANALAHADLADVPAMPLAAAIAADRRSAPERQPSRSSSPAGEM